MGSINETGHGKNVAFFNELIASCAGNSERYHPSNNLISLENLKALSSRAGEAISAINNIKPAFDKASNERQTGFSVLSKLVTRIYNAAVASGMSKQSLSNIASIKRKLQGTRVTPRLTEDEKKALFAEGIVKKEVSTSQQSFDSLLLNFDMLIKEVSIHPEYKPNETDLQTESLKQVLTTLKSVNEVVVQAGVPLDKARANRDAIGYTPETGLVDIALATKAYIKSVDTVWYRQISGIAFRREKT